MRTKVLKYAELRKDFHKIVFQDPSYDYVDLGGAYVGSAQENIIRLAKELNVELHPVDYNGKTVLNTSVSI